MTTILWRCPKCGRGVPMQPHEFPIQCSCGLRDDGEVVTLGSVAPVVTGCRGCRYEDPLKQVTACITYHRREACLERLVRSIKQFYPRLEILTQDTGGNLSWGRNELARRCPTPYLLMLEEDFEFTADTALEYLMDVLLHDSEIAGAGGGIVEHGTEKIWAHDLEAFRGCLTAAPSRQPVRTTREQIGYQPCELITNFGIWRRDILRRFPWDEALHLGEHRKFYWDLKQTAQWRVAAVNGVSILHHKDRSDAAYARDRARAAAFIKKAERRIGLRMQPPEGFYRWNDRRPNILVFGIGHCNTTITTKQIAQLGWNLGDADEEYAESVSVRALNIDKLANQFRIKHAREALGNLPQPWVLKDPRFSRTLPAWLPLFEPYRPLMLWITKDRETVDQSYLRRGEIPPSDKRWRFVEQCYHDWPWAKLKLEAEQVAAACAMFKTEQISPKPTIY